MCQSCQSWSRCRVGGSVGWGIDRGVGSLVGRFVGIRIGIDDVSDIGANDEIIVNIDNSIYWHVDESGRDEFSRQEMTG